MLKLNTRTNAIIANFIFLFERKIDCVDFMKIIKNKLLFLSCI